MNEIQKQATKLAEMALKKSAPSEGGHEMDWTNEEILAMCEETLRDIQNTDIPDPESYTESSHRVALKTAYSALEKAKEACARASRPRGRGFNPNF